MGQSFFRAVVKPVTSPCLVDLSLVALSTSRIQLVPVIAETAHKVKFASVPVAHFAYDARQPPSRFR
jgi:hypothetical protein